MKKFLALALAVAMIMAIVPAALAAPAAVNTNRYNDKSASVNTDGMAKVAKTEISEKYQKATMSRSITKASLSDVNPIALSEISEDEAETSGYWLSGSEAFTEVTDLFDDGRPIYAQRFTTLDETGEALKPYEKGETVWFNYDLYSSFTDGTLVSLPEKEDGYEVEVICMEGQLQDDGDTVNFTIVSDYLSNEGGISVKMTAPADDTYYMFFVFIDEAATLKLDAFGAWLTISAMKGDSNFKTVTKGEEMTVGKSVATKVGTNDTKKVIAPMSTMYSVTYAQAHKITLEGGTKYVAHFTSNDNIGVHIWFCDENMDVITDSYISADLLSMYSYEDLATVVWPTVTGTYYLVVGGYWTTDEGTVDATITEWDQYPGAPELPEINETIDLNNLGTEDYLADNESWGYHYFSDDKVGTVIVATPGVYTLKGDRTDIFVQAYDGVKLVYDGASTGAVMLRNEVAPIAIEAKGQATIADQQLWGYSIFNADPLCSAGLYIVGDELKIEGTFGIILENSPVHLCAKKIVVDTTSAEGYYPIAIWVAGINSPALTLGKNAKLNDGNKVAKMYNDENGNYMYGYTIAKNAELYKNDWSAASLSFELTTDGMPSGGAAMLGDANCDGKVNTGDATMVLKHAATIIVLEGEGAANADINQDGKVNTGDATMILKVVAGIIAQP